MFKYLFAKKKKDHVTVSELRTTEIKIKIMSCYSRAKLAVNFYRSLTSKIISQRFSGAFKPTLQGTGNGRRPAVPRWFWYVGFGVPATVYYTMRETIPYTNRSHSVLLSYEMEKKLGEEEFERIKKGVKTLHETDPQSVRVSLILRNIVQAFPREVKHCKHLDGLIWEVLVVDNPTYPNAMCLPGGKIMVFTGLFQLLKTDTEIATIIGHEVGHVVARYEAEKFTLGIGFSIIRVGFAIIRLIPFIRLPFVYFDLDVDTMLRLPWRRRRETEADYIGLLLIASAGYDPRIAPQVYEKLKVADFVLEKYSTHPCSQKRVEFLEQTQVMEKALAIYKEVRSKKTCQEIRGSDQPMPSNTDWIYPEFTFIVDE